MLNTATSVMLAMERLQLICEGVDTVSDIYINEKYVGSTKDAFLQYAFDVKDMLVVNRACFSKTTSSRYNSIYLF